LRATGIGSVTCARHEMYRPNGMGDLQKGERYANLDLSASKINTRTIDTRIWITYYCPASLALPSNRSPSHMILPASGESTSPHEPIIPLSPTHYIFHRRFRCSLLSPNSISRLTSRSVTVHFHSITLQVLGEPMAKALNGTGQCSMELPLPFL
jgi:hypothetical protein